MGAPRCVVLMNVVALVGCGARTPLGLGRAPDSGGADANLTDAETADAGGDAGGVLLFGGMQTANTSTPTYLGDTWRWDGVAWTDLALAGPSPRALSTVTTLLGRVVLFGGATSDAQGSTVLGDTWSWNGAAWAQLSVSPSPPPRSGAAFAAVQATAILFGGYGVNDYLGDTWRWDGATWSQMDVVGPSARIGAVAASLGGYLYLYSGTNSSDSPLDDTWRWDGSSWVQLNVNGPIAQLSAMGLGAVPLTGCSAATLDGKVFVYCRNTTWTWDGASWTYGGNIGGHELTGCGMASTQDALILFGGGGGVPGSDSNATWMWRGTTWQQLGVTGPSARESPAMTSMP